MNKKLFYITLGLLAIVELISFAGYVNPTFGLIGFWTAVILVLIYAFKDLKYALLALLAELIIGSQGYLLYYGEPQDGVSLRIAIWIIVMAFWAGKEVLGLLRKTTTLKSLFDFPYAKQLGFLGIALLIGALVGYLNGSIYFFLEAKRWVYILVIIPILRTFKTKQDLTQLQSVAAAAVSWLVLKTFILLYIFSHGFISLIPSVYTWMRENLLGEITNQRNGFPRIFLQSQVYVIPAFFLFFSLGLKRLKEGARKKQAILLLITSACAAVILISLSRSFWIGSAAAAICGAMYFLISRRPGFKQSARAVGYGLVTTIIAVALIFIVVKFPLPTAVSSIDASLLRDRASQLEAGAASRWALLPIMSREVIKSPVWGFGFGKTLTYYTSDPRIMQSTVNGEFTTYAFEWGWLDILLKLGIFGLLAYGYLLFTLLRDAINISRNEVIIGFTLGLGLIAMAVLHFFTPYLNHPLGFGYLAITMVVLGRYRRG